ncbi:sterol desaturase family protein [Sphingomonas sp. HF-S3]|uniref:Sterol desaturase family protein n=1 Tax=Sphingomonas rustica TaxID=3103142 RepID=A0ABV0BC85_9SPHN
MDLIETLYAGAVPYLWSWSFAFIFMTVVEMLVPRGRQPLRTRLPGLAFWAIWLPVSALVQAGFTRLWVAAGIEPLLTLPLGFHWTGAAALVLAPIAAAILYDFFFYWCHRFQHRFLWRFHAVHHSIRDLNSVNAYHHITEPLIQTVLILIPASLIVSEAGATSAVVTVFLYLHGAFIHSPTRYHLGAGRLGLVDNRFHRIHHSLEPRHFDTNFGAFTTLWDRVFGTAHFPAAEEWPDCGIAEAGPPRTVGEWLAFPYRLGRDPAADRAAGNESSALEPQPR